MDEADAEAGDVTAVAEEAGGHEGVLCQLSFDDDEEGGGEDPEDDEADYGGGFPGVGLAAVFEAEEEHEGAADDEEGA